jgi:translation initiation factor IF-2
VVILGLSSVPQVGDMLKVTASESQAQKEIHKRLDEEHEETKTITLSNLYDQISAGKMKELNVILKADVQGSIEPIVNSLGDLSTKDVQVRTLHTGTGNITESDVMLAIASKGIVIGFGVGTQPGAKRLAEREGVSIRSYKIIYELVNDVASALKGMLEPTYSEVIEGRAEVRSVFSVAKKEKVAGVYVTEGKLSRGASVRVWRGKEKLAESTITSLKRFKEDAREVAAGYECGVGLKDFSDFHAGDILESFRMELNR